MAHPPLVWVRGLLVHLWQKVVGMARERAQHEYRHRTRRLTRNSIPLYQRCTNERLGLLGGFSGPRAHRPTQSRMEADHLGVVFNLLLQEIRNRGYWDRMANPPRQARSVDELHANNCKSFERVDGHEFQRTVRKRTAVPCPQIIDGS